MVNTGRPSGACQTCKARRIKCDGFRPSCSQCQKSKRICLGWPLAAKVKHAEVDAPSRQDATLKLWFDNPLIGPLRPTRPYRIQQAVADFMKNFIVNTNRSAMSPGFLDRLEVAITLDDAKETLIPILDLTGSSFTSLQQLSQSPEHRKAQIADYGAVLSRLRTSIASRSRCSLLPASIFLLCLYLMTTSGAPDEDEWRMHLKALLLLLKSTSQSMDPNFEWRSLLLIDSFEHAISLVHDKAPADPIPHFHLLNTTLTRLWHIGPYMDSLFQKSRQPRKLDVQKLHIVMKKIYKDIILLRTALLSEGAESGKTLNNADRSWNAYFWSNTYKGFSSIQEATKWLILWSMIIMCGTFNLEAGQFLSSTKDCSSTNKSIDVRSAIAKAVDDICASAPYFFINGDLSKLQECSDTSQPRLKTLNGLLLMWPLYIALQAAEVESQQTWIRDRLCDIGRLGFIPKAWAMAQVEKEEFLYAEAFGGFLLLELGSIVLPR